MGGVNKKRLRIFVNNKAAHIIVIVAFGVVAAFCRQKQAVGPVPLPGGHNLGAGKIYVLKGPGRRRKV